MAGRQQPELNGDKRSDTLRVRLLQTDPALGDIDANLAHIEALIAQRPGVDLVVTPELATHGYHLGLLDDTDPLTLTDPRIRSLGSHGPAVVLGLVEQARHLVYDSAAIITGDAVHAQRKLYLPTYRQWEERKHFSPGAAIRQYEIAGAQLAALICNDLWQPVVPWLAAHAGAEVLAVPVNSVVAEVGRPSNEVWETILMHTAMTLQCYVVFVNRVGVEAGARFWGGSRVIGPTGETLGELGDEPGELEVELDIGRLRRLRRQWPLLREARPEFVIDATRRLAEEAW